MSFFEFENEGFFLGAGQGHMLRFALTTIVGHAQSCNEATFLFQGKKIEELHNHERVFNLTPDDIFRVNPNTLTCPIFQTRCDAEITKKIYNNSQVLIREGTTSSSEENPWDISFMRMFDMSNDSHLFKNFNQLHDLGGDQTGNQFIVDNEQFLPVYESKMIQLYTHRHGDFTDSNNERAHILPTIPTTRLNDPDYLISPYYWISKDEVLERVKETGWKYQWFFCWRNVADSRASARTLITTVIPFSGVGNSLPVYMPLLNLSPRKISVLLANLSSIVLDFAARMKVGGLNFNFFIFKQLPVLSPSRYIETDLDFIVPRVLELTYTAHDLQPWAKDLGYDAPPFTFDPVRRAQLRAELDAWYAKAYGLTRDELRYILDPADVMGDDYPSETFRVLKNNELREFGEYRTRRLVLEAWDSLSDKFGE